MTRKLDIKRPESTAWLAAVCCGLITHGFALVNILHNYDDILQMPKGYGAGIESGRWLLHILGDFLQNVLGMGYNLSAVNGMLYIFMIAVSAAFLVNALRVRSRLGAGLIGCLMVTFPTVASTMTFRFTAPYYGLSLLLAVLAVWVVSRCKWGTVLSAVCIAASTGLYQAYVPVTIALFLILLMQAALEEEAQLTKLIRQGVHYCICLILGIGLYFLLQKLALNYYPFLYQRVLNEYQGIDTMGRIPLSLLPWLIKKAWLSGVLFPLQNYCGLAATGFLRCAWVALMLLTAVQVGALMYARRKKPLNCAFFLLMLLFFPLAVNFVVVMAPEGVVYTIMVYAFVLEACFPVVLAEYLPEKTKGKWMPRLLGFLAALIIFNNGYHANLNYTRLYFANEQVKYYFSGMITQVRMTEGYTPDKKWITIGEEIRDPNLWDIWYEESLYNGFPGNSAKELMNVDYSAQMWFDVYLGGYGVGYPHLQDQQEKQALAEDLRVREMPCWPSQGSIKIVDEYVVIKLQETTQ